MVYSFLNQKCPTCDKEISPYHYKIVKGKKYHIGCKVK